MLRSFWMGFLATSYCVLQSVFRLAKSKGKLRVLGRKTILASKNKKKHQDDCFGEKENNRSSRVSSAPKIMTINFLENIYPHKDLSLHYFYWGFCTASAVSVQ